MSLFKKKECPESKDIKTLARIGVIAAWHKDENGTHYTARQRPTAIISCFGSSTTERINKTAETTLFEIRPDYEIES